METLFVDIKLTKDGKWEIFRDFGKARFTKKQFDTHTEAENWIEENKPKKYTQVWCDHKIDSHTGHLMTIKEWKESCDFGGFIDYDGDGDLLDENFEYIFSGIRPSDYTDHNHHIIERASYVLWYNK